MRFEEALWDGSVPSYAPCLRWQKPGYPYWVAPPRYVKAGYATKRVPLTRGTPDDEHRLERALRCRQLTQEMVRWWEGMERSGPPPGSWGWLIGRYKSDEFSDIQRVKPYTRKGYLNDLAMLEEVLGETPLAATNFEMLMKIRLGKEAKGRSVDHIHRFFSVMRRVIGHGVKIEADHATRIKSVLSEVRIKSTAPRSVSPTRADIEAVVRESDKDGNFTFSVGTLIQFWFGLRAVDVRGQDQGGQWEDGLTWEMFSPGLKSFEKVISKTRDSIPEPYLFDLTHTPDIRDRLLELYNALPEGKRTGPVMISRKTGEPFTVSGWGQAWRRYRKAAGVDPRIQNRDIRAGAASDAVTSGAGGMALRNAMQHRNVTTTDRYVRNRSADLNKVVAMRRNRK